MYTYHLQGKTDQYISVYNILGIKFCYQAIMISRVAQSCYSVIGDKPFLWSKPKFDLP